MTINLSPTSEVSKTLSQLGGHKQFHDPITLYQKHTYIKVSCDSESVLVLLYCTRKGLPCPCHMTMIEFLLYCTPVRACLAPVTCL